VVMWVNDLVVSVSTHEYDYYEVLVVLNGYDGGGSE
jgi:hypothetical protein